MGKRYGNKKRMYLSAKRHKPKNLENYLRCRRLDLPYMGNNSWDKISVPNTSQEITFEDTNLGNNTEDKFAECSSLCTFTDKNEPENVSEINITKADSDFKFDISGRRIVNLNYILQKLSEISNHAPQFGCSLVNIKAIAEKRNGLISIITFKCDMCNDIFRISTDAPSSSQMDVNSAAVSGIMSIGCGQSNLEEFLSVLNIPPMSSKTYQKYHKNVCEGWQKTALQNMKEAAMREAEYAHSHSGRSLLPSS